MSLKSAISAIFSKSNATISLRDLYARFSAKYREHSIRARVYELEGEVRRVGKGLYISASAHMGMTADSLNALPELAEIGYKADFVILDLPYKSGGQKGGNRDLAPFPVIDPDQFGLIVESVKGLVRDENTPVLFIFSEGKSSARAKAKFQAEMDSRFNLAASGTYTKLNKNGTRCSFGKYLLPGEGLFVYSLSGNVDAGQLDLDIEAVRPGRGTYPTQKPESLLTRIFDQFRNVGQILDPFAGSGSTSRAAAQLGIGSLNIDIETSPIA